MLPVTKIGPPPLPTRVPRPGPPRLPTTATELSDADVVVVVQAVDVSDIEEVDIVDVVDVVDVVEDAAGLHAPPVPVAFHEGQPSILVVDDDPAMVEFLTMFLGEQYTVYAATTGPEAIAILESLRPDLVISDVGLPGADGYEVAAALKRRPTTRSVPLVFLTSHDAANDLVRGINAGARQYMTKPIEPSVLMAKVARWLGRPIRSPR